MKSSTKKATADRRSFLKLAGVGVIAGGAAAVGGGSAEPAQAETKGDSLYRETEHVKRFYELARFI